MLETRQILNKNSSRWASRTPSQQIRRKRWVPPDLTQNPQRLGVISHYSDSNYVLGNSSPAALGRFAKHFKSGSDPNVGSHAESGMLHELEDNLPTSPHNAGESSMDSVPSLAEHQPEVGELPGDDVYELQGSEVDRPQPTQSVDRLRKSVRNASDEGNLVAKSKHESRWNFF